MLIKDLPLCIKVLALSRIDRGRTESDIVGSAFAWDKTPEGWNFWNEINQKRFDVYFQKYGVPEKWAVKCGANEVKQYCGKHISAVTEWERISDNAIAHFPEIEDSHHFNSSVGSGYTLLTFEQFKKFVLDKEIIMKKWTIQDITEGKVQIKNDKKNIDKLQKVMKVAFPSSSTVTGDSNYYCKGMSMGWVAYEKPSNLLPVMDIKEFEFEESDNKLLTIPDELFNKGMKEMNGKQLELFRKLVDPWDRTISLENAKKFLKEGDVCGIWQNRIKAEFPELYEKSVDLSEFIGKIGDASNHMFVVRSCGEYGQKAFKLAPKFNWELKEEDGYQLLIPTKK